MDEIDDLTSLADPAGDVDVLDEVYELMLLAKNGLKLYLKKKLEFLEK